MHVRKKSAWKGLSKERRLRVALRRPSATHVRTALGNWNLRMSKYECRQNMRRWSESKGISMYESSLAARTNEAEVEEAEGKSRRARVDSLSAAKMFILSARADTAPTPNNFHNIVYPCHIERSIQVKPWTNVSRRKRERFPRRAVPMNVLVRADDSARRPNCNPPGGVAQGGLLIPVIRHWVRCRRRCVKQNDGNGSGTSRTGRLCST